MSLFLYPLDQAVARAIEASHIPVRSRLGTVVIAFEAVIGAVVLTIAIMTTFFGLGYVVLANDAMSPNLPAGTLAVTSRVDAAQLAIGDVITVAGATGELATVRVTGLAPASTGDARLVSVGVDSGAGSAALEVSAIDRVVASAPGLGEVVNVAATPVMFGLAALMLGAVLAQLPRKRVTARHALTA